MTCILKVLFHETLVRKISSCTHAEPGPGSWMVQCSGGKDWVSTFTGHCFATDKTVQQW